MHPVLATALTLCLVALDNPLVVAQQGNPSRSRLLGASHQAVREVHVAVPRTGSRRHPGNDATATIGKRGLPSGRSSSHTQAGAPGAQNGTLVVGDPRYLDPSKLLAADGETDDNFGYSVDIDGNTAVIGAYGGNDAGPFSGAVYVFVHDGKNWSEQQKLTATDAAAGDFFGHSVSISKNSLVVGALYGNGGLGAVYVFRREGTNWTQEQRIIPSVPESGDEFGMSVAIAGNRIIVGATGHSAPSVATSGASFVFDRNSGVWTETQKIYAPDADPGDNFGRSVAIEGEIILVGAYLDDDLATDAGSAYVFKISLSVWSLEQKLTSGDSDSLDYFGFSVALSNHTALVGAWGDDVHFVDQGAAYVFERIGTTWKLQKKLMADDAREGDFLGTSVAISADLAVLGSPYDDSEGLDAGSSYVFHRTGTQWAQERRVLAEDGTFEDFFGRSVAVSGKLIMIGARGSDTMGSSAGACYAYEYDNLLNLDPRGFVVVSPPMLPGIYIPPAILPSFLP